MDVRWEQDRKCSVVILLLRCFDLLFRQVYPVARPVRVPGGPIELVGLRGVGLQVSKFI